MRRRVGTLLAAAMLAGAAIAVSLVSASSARSVVLTVHVIEHATTDTTVDVGARGDSTGDLLTFHNDVYDSTDTTKVGTDQGDCIRIDPAAGSWECRWVTMLARGSLTVEGPFYDAANSTLAITGGTGIYRGAMGGMRLASRSGGTEYDFIFRIIG